MRGLFGVILGAALVAGCRVRPATTVPKDTAAPTLAAPMTAGDVAVARTEGFDTAEFTRRADEVVVAVVERVESRYVTNSYGDRIIVSVASLRINRVLKGRLPKGEPLFLEFQGGTVGDVTLHVSHACTFEPAERVVVFVARGPTRRTVLGGDRGKLRVEDGRIPALGLDLAAFEKRVSAQAAEEGAGR